MSRIIPALLILLIMATILPAQKLELLSPHLVQFGKVPEDTTLTTVIRFKNAGEKTLTIDDVHTSCGCTVAQLAKEEYDPGEAGSIEISLNTKGFSGVIRKYVTIKLKEGKPELTRVVLEANVTPKIEFDPRFIDFQKMTLDVGSSQKTLTIRNHLSEPIEIVGIEYDNPRLKIEPAAVKIAPKSSAQLKILYFPKEKGRDDTILKLQFSRPMKLTKRVPVFIFVQ
ncbi:MAG: DUF1573 domain-containing protein [Calditrichia bacterium]